MMKNDKRIIEMTLEGDFVSPPGAGKPPFGKLPISTRIMAWAVVVAVISASVLLAALALWLVLIILPFVLGTVLVAYLAFRYQVWRARGSWPGWRGPGRWGR